MAARLSWLTACKLSQLQAVATATGVNTGGTKKVLSSRLLSALQEEKFALPIYPPSGKDVVNPQQIISIDMGIRNLAYCRITLPSSSSKGIALPTISAWERVVVAPKVGTPSDASLESVKEVEVFDPATYSQYAYDLITRLLTCPSSQPPDHILIERQRFRSMGGSAVQEWTLRVNMFEAMLYAVLRTLNHQGIWKGRVWPITPNKVGRFWLDGVDGARMTKKHILMKSDGEDIEGGIMKKGTKANGKGEKIALVNQWLHGGGKFELREGAKKTAEAWLSKKNRREKTKTMNGAVGTLGKLDDLADCLLQGLAWVKWEVNRKAILEKGLEALDEVR